MSEHVCQRDALRALSRFLAASRRLVVLTGAGVSTESGIPDYRDAAGDWKRVQPMTLQEFVRSASARRRYWARALIGWQLFARVSPNVAHYALAQYEASGRLRTLITQNVDGLHQQAGSRRVIDLHGRIDAVECLDCRAGAPREVFQAALERRNPGWVARAGGMAPDGDADIDDADLKHFEVPPCERCGGVVKPAVVFFGESVPRARVASARAAVAAADGLLVAGTSLMVYSGYRFVRAAREHRVPIALVNLGRTRADAEVDLRVHGSCGEVLQAVLGAATAVAVE